MDPPVSPAAPTKRTLVFDILAGVVSVGLYRRYSVCSVGCDGRGKRSGREGEKRVGRGTTEQDLGVGDVINSQFPPKAGYYPLLSHPEWTMVGRVDVQFPSFEGRFFWSDVMIIF